MNAPSPRSNITLLCAMTTSAMVNTTTCVLAAANVAPIATPTSPTHIAVRRCRRSATEPVVVESKPDSSLIANATPSRSSEMPRPPAMVARNAGANRKHALAAVRARVSLVMLWRTSPG